MCFAVLSVLMLQVAAARPAPVHLLLRPQQRSTQPQPLLQRQLLELQQAYTLQRNAAPAQLTMSPVIIFVQNPADVETDKKHDAIKTYANKEIVDEDMDSVIIEADSEETEREPPRVLLLPNYARLSIGDVISAIPFLPIEINVPDTIGWAYNGISSGISSIISIFGRLPVNSSAQDSSQQMKLKSVLHHLEVKKQSSFAPIIIMPIIPQVVPIQLPIRV